MVAVVEVRVIDTEVAEYLVLLWFDAELWVAKNYEELVVCYCSFIFLHLEGHPIPDADHQPEAYFAASGSDGLVTVAGHISTVNCLSN